MHRWIPLGGRRRAAASCRWRPRRGRRARLGSPARVAPRLAAALVALALAAGAGAAGADETTAPALTEESFARRLGALIDDERARHGLPPLARASCAQRSAERAAVGLAQGGRLHHASLPALLQACDAVVGAENLGTGQATPEAVLRAWLASARHRRNLLGARYSRVGIAAARSAGGRWFAVASFVGD